ncbi:hypothetical protein [Mucilaginibacter pocheonensis]|uniref:Fimbrillin-A associated anchor protein Mfa1 and Mfa2 n=1 Tax=Mucilaginibacter pocheonensis TaxID=398050 RepID=A0ABU1TID7_9SPHI|nr:hypothetical protein [Mucilaginibacter pocheonensis]MDR6945089.1 hypothetical protein [Mucilaginibacter pocheonensis]
MKKILTILLGLSAGLISCKKEHIATSAKHEESSAQKYPVSFAVAPFDVQTGTLSLHSTAKKTSALKDNFKYLYYYVTKQSDSLHVIKTIKQKSTDEGFGRINDTLAAGKYNIFIFGAARSDVEVFTGTEDFYYPGLLLAYEGYNGHRPPNSIGDNFLKKISITVGKMTNQDVKLDRIVGKINVKITDPIPSGVSKIVVNFNSVPDVLDLYTGEEAITNSIGGETVTQTYIVKPEDVGKTGLTMGDYFWAGGLWIDLSYYDLNGNQVDQKIPTGSWLVEANKAVTFSGKLFSISTGFSVGVNSGWESETDQPFEF